MSRRIQNYIIDNSIIKNNTNAQSTNPAALGILREKVCKNIQFFCIFRDCESLLEVLQLI